MKIPVDKRISKFVADNIYVEGKKIDFNMYKPMKFVYDINPPELLVLAGRQIGKSVYLASKSSTKSILKPHNRMLYVSPLEAQAKTWSKTKLGPIIKNSPYINYFFKSSPGDNVFYKENNLGSYIELTYASLGSGEPARVRGKSADDLFIDETQDIVPDALPVIKETITSSMDPTITYAGTAKSEENLTGVLWLNGTQIERVYKCPSCSKYNVITYENIGPNHLICKYCRAKLEQSMSKFTVVQQGKNGVVAVRLPQVIMPIHQTEKKYADIFQKKETYSKEKFEQEVLGLPTGGGSRLVTEEEILKNTTNKPLLTMVQPEDKHMYKAIFMGIDWSGEGREDKSRTAVAVIAHRRDDKFELIGAKIIPPGDPMGTIETVKNMIHLFKADYVSADAGMGAIQNAQIMTMHGFQRFKQIRYIGGNTKPFSYDGATNTLSLNKTKAIDSIMMLLKGWFRMPSVLGNQRSPAVLLWPQKSDAIPLIKDIMNEFSQEGKTGKIWTHSPDMPDDFLHSLVFGFYGYMFMKSGMCNFH